MAQVSSTSSSNQSEQQVYPNNDLIQLWNSALGTQGGLAQWVVNNYAYPGGPNAQVAAPTDLMNQYWQQAGSRTGAPDVSGAQANMDNISRAMNGQLAPTSYNFTPGSAAFNNPFANGAPQVTAPTGIGSTAAAYQYNPMQVQAPTVTGAQVSGPAPGSVSMLSGLPQIQQQQLQNFQMQAPDKVQAPNLQNFQMQAAAPVSAQQVTGPQSWTTPGTAQQYMSPYTQNVIDTQLAQAQVQEQQQLQQQKGQAAQAGAFGGSREAVEEANTSIGYQQMAANLEAQGLQNAYQQGMGQFTQEQAMGQQAQMANQQAGLQAALSNQQAQQQANVQNLSSYLQTQGLGAQTGLAAAQGNQQMQFGTNEQDLAALLQTQGLGATLNQQGQLANQSVALQSGLYNQQAQEFMTNLEQQARFANQASTNQANLANAGYQMQGSLANQASGLQAALAANQLGFQGAVANQNWQGQTGLANQAATMQGMGMTGNWGFQGAEQTQNLGFQGQIMGAQTGLQGTQLNLANLGQQGGLAFQGGELGLQGYGAGLQGLGYLQQGATSQQGYQQQIADTAYQDWLNNMQLPMQAMGTYMQDLSMSPSWGQTTTGANYGTSQTDQPTNPWSIVGGIIGGAASAFAGGFGGGFGKAAGTAAFGAKGGLYDAAKKKGFADGGLADVTPFRRRLYAPLRRHPIMRRHSVIEPLDRAAYRVPNESGLGELV